ncbi:MAG: hypothetical protein R6U86_05255 [Bacteroidales bacterium]
MMYRIQRPNYIRLEGARVLAGMIVHNRDLNLVTEQKVNPDVIEVDNIPGMETVTVKWIVENPAGLSVTVNSEKGGVVSAGQNPRSR